MDITQNPEAMGQLQKALGNKNVQNNMGQVLVMGTLMGCVKKAAGTEAMQAFYNKMQTAGKEIGQLCKTDHPVQARDLALKTVDENANDPVAKATLNCYDQQAASIKAMGGDKLANDLALYASWMRNPSKAHAEVTPQTVCRNKIK